jgi:tetratricopeptide (TPR) repeat protein
LQRLEQLPKVEKFTDWPEPLRLLGSHASSRPLEQCEAAVESARMKGDRVAEAHALSELGHAYFMLPDASRAVDCYLEAVAIARELGDRKAEGEYLGCLGNDLLAQREFEQASRYCKDALGIARERGDRENEAN